MALLGLPFLGSLCLCGSHLLHFGPLRQSLPLLAEAGAIEDLRVEHALRSPADRQIEHAAADHPADVAEELAGVGNAVRGQDDVVQRAEAMRPGDRLANETIE